MGLPFLTHTGRLCYGRPMRTALTPFAALAPASLFHHRPGESGRQHCRRGDHAADRPETWCRPISLSCCSRHHQPHAALLADRSCDALAPPSSNWTRCWALTDAPSTDGRACWTAPATKPATLRPGRWKRHGRRRDPLPRLDPQLSGAELPGCPRLITGRRGVRHRTGPRRIAPPPDDAEMKTLDGTPREQFERARCWLATSPC